MALSKKTRNWLEGSMPIVSKIPNWVEWVVPEGPKSFFEKVCNGPTAKPEVVKEMRENEAEVLKIMAPYFGMY